MNATCVKNGRKQTDMMLQAQLGALNLAARHGKLRRIRQANVACRQKYNLTHL
jgi:hypothetical protein